MPNPIEERILIDGRVCPWWFAYTFDNPVRRWLHNPHKILSPYVAEGDTAVDIGCGMGPFTVELARLVGPGGRVIAVDLQDKMLQRVKERVNKAGLADRVQLHRCTPDSLDLTEQADFALAFWMAHEVSSTRSMVCLGMVAASCWSNPRATLARKILSAKPRQLKRPVSPCKRPPRSPSAALPFSQE